MKRIIATFLVVVMMLPLVACGGGAGTTGGGGGGGEEQTYQFIDEISRDYDGAFLDRELAVTVDSNYLYEMYAEEDSAETVDQLVYKRNSLLETRFGCDIIAIPQQSTGALDLETHYNYVQKSLLRSENNFDLIMLMAYQTGKLITDGNYLDWRSEIDLPITSASIKAGKAWWPDGINKDCTVAGHQYLAVSDICLTAMEMCYAVLYNKDIEKNNNVARTQFNKATLYEAVDAGAWTVDALYSIVKDFHFDSAESGTVGSVDENDVFGIAVGGGTDTDAWAFAFNIHYVSNDGVNMPELWTMTTRTVSAISTLRQIYNSRGAYGRVWGDTYPERTQFFVDGHALFDLSTLEQLKSDVFHEMESDYGILPYPKFDTNQKTYGTGTMDHYTCLSIPYFNIENLEMTDVLVEALSAESTNSVKDAYYESILKYNSTRDEDSVRMVDLVMKGRASDISTYHYSELTTTGNGNHNGALGLFFRRMLGANTTVDPASQWNDKERDVIELLLEDLINDYLYMFD